jgi:hypothetical protein
MPNDVRPYFVPSPESVRWGPWMLGEGEAAVPLPGYIEGWEPGTDLHICRNFEIDETEFKSETLTSLDNCVLALSWRSSTTDMVGSIPPIAIPASRAGVIYVELEGSKLAGTLRLYSRLVLAQQPGGSRPIGAAQIPGSILSEHEQVLVLEHPTTMFPLNIVDFARTTHDADASWHLDIGGDLEAPFMGSVLLEINSRDRDLCDAITRIGVESEFQRTLSDDLEAGIAALIIDLAILNREELLETDWVPASVGDVLKNTLRRAGLVDAAPPSALDLADLRTRVAGAVRKMGHGRIFR